MPVLSDPTTAAVGPRVTVRASAAVELCWVLHAALREDFRAGHRALQVVFDEHPELLADAAGFWADGASNGLGFLELLVLAHHGDELFAPDLDGLMARIEELGATVPAQLAFNSESPQDRLVLQGRLARLRRTPSLRRRYAALVAETWSAVRPAWEHAGRRAVEAACADKREQLARGVAWPEVVRTDCDLGDQSSHLATELGPTGELAIVPAYFTHKGLLLDLPGMVVVGVRADSSDARTRVRTETLARALKTLADPTRLGIVDLLMSGPSTVTELARRFGVAQPTVSNHVKLLRGVGLVRDARVGTRRQLVVDPDVVAEILDQLRTMLEPALPVDAPGAPGGEHRRH
jgi:DNA-binding transcriptional ArsR family regulator